MPDRKPSRGFIDTSVVVDLEELDPRTLPDEITVSAVTLAELAAGVQASTDPIERARRQALVQFVEAQFDSVPFDASAARAYGQLYAAVVAAGRKPRGGRAMDLLIAASALAHRLPFYTRNGEDFRELARLLAVIEV